MVAPTPYKPTKEATSPASAEFRNTLKAWEIEPRTVTEYWPQANGLVERFNKVLLKFIQILLANLLPPNEPRITHQDAEYLANTCHNPPTDVEKVDAT